VGSESVAWPWLIVMPGPTPLAELTGRLAALAGVDAAAAYERVSADPAVLGKLAAQAGGDGRLILVVDQFEELFTQCANPAERLAFAAALAAAAPALLLIAVRADFYPHCTELPPMLPMLESGQFVVGPLSTRQLRRAVRNPALDNGLQLEPGLEELILADLGIRPGHTDEDRAGYEPGALPLLAHVLRVTWEHRAGDTMTVADYGHAGGIRHAVAETAERIYLDLDAEGRAALRSALLSLVTIVDGTTIRRAAPPTEADIAVLRRLIAARLVTADKSAVTISHEALLTGWPRLATWVAQARDEILLHQRLAQATTDWALAGEDPDLLWRGALLAAAIDPSDQRPNRPPDQQRFLAAGLTEAQRRQRLQERTSRRLRRLLIGLVAALLIAVGGAVVAVDQRNTAVSNYALAQSREHAAKARSELFIDPHDAIRDALDAWQTAHTTEAHSALVLAQQATLVGKLGSELNASSVSVSPDGRFVAVGYYLDGRFQLWDATTLQQIGGDLRNPVGNLLALKFSPDSRYLAVGSASVVAGLTIWDTTGTMLHSLPGFGMPAWLPDSSAVLAIRSSGAPAGRLIGSWSPADGRLIRTVTAAIVAVNSLDVSSDGASVALAGRGDGQVLRRADGKSIVRIPGAEEIKFDGRDSAIVRDSAGVITRWELPKGGRAATLTGRYETPTTGHMAVAPGGTVVVQGPNEREILLLTTAGNGARPPLTGFDGAANDVALSGDGQLLAAVGPGGAPALMRLGVDRLPHPQVVGDIAFDDTGRRLATVSDDPVVRIWDPQTSRLTNSISVGSTPLQLDYAPDGSLAVALEDSTIVLLDPGGTPRGVLRPDDGFFFSRPTFSPDGRLLAAVQNWVDTETSDEEAKRQDEPGAADVMIWDTATLTPRVRLETTGHAAYAVAFDPDGTKVLATSNRNETDLVGKSGPLQQGAVWSWRVADGMSLARHDMATGSLAGIRVSPDGTKVAVAAESGKAAILDADSLRPLKDIGNHRDELKNVEFSPDGALLVTASGSNDDVPRVWDVATGRLVTEIRGHNNALTALRFSPDGAILATASEDWTVGLWRLEPVEAIRRLCAMLTPSANATGPALPAACN
jgi:WD40 repeat protein